MRGLMFVFIMSTLFLGLLPARADSIYLEPQVFVKQQFEVAPPKAKVIWLDQSLQTKLANILHHPYVGMRIRYWQDKQQTVWVLNEIGKEKNITVGICIAQGLIKDLKVLVFRESRGWEVKHDFFTNQFKLMFLNDKLHLNRHVDSITGATLSVRAIQKIAKIALLLDREVQ